MFNYIYKMYIFISMLWNALMYNEKQNMLEEVMN